ncbi:ABC transporter ATP-binding protein [Candidatus Peregrinibacteria bacterium]|nr:MAG: ABC transporter ATP-binding protein [Candidatus Peregrinibacteria bacterium]
MLTFENVIKTFTAGGEQWTFGPVSLSFFEHESTALIGRSGSGKSTLLSLASGLLSADSGNIFFEGESIKKMSEKNRAKHWNENVGFIFQEFFLFPDLTVLENVMIPLLVRKIPRKKAKEQSEEMLSQVGLSSRKHHHPSEISGGQHQRVAIARALVGKPKLILADEPTGNLDPKTGDEIIELLLHLQKETEALLLVVTHDHFLADQIPRKIEMENGNILSDSSSS